MTGFANSFIELHGAQSLCRRWALEKDISEFLHFNVAGGVLLVDALIGDGLRDQISPELFSGFKNLMGEGVQTADDVRDILVEKLMIGDLSVAGLINKVKGQIGENIFQQTATNAGFTARLARSGSQEAWDVAVTSDKGATNYVQVKTIESPDAIVSYIKDISEKLPAGHIMDGNQVVRQIDYAVPNDILDEVVSKVFLAGIDVKITGFDLSAHEAAQIVQDGFNNVAILGFGNFINQLAGGTLTALTVHTLVQMYLMHKGASEAEKIIPYISTEMVYSTGYLSAALGMETLLSKGLLTTGSLPAIAVVIATGLTARGLLRRMMARHNFVGFLQQENASLHCKQLALL